MGSDSSRLKFGLGLELGLRLRLGLGLGLGLGVELELGLRLGLKHKPSAAVIFPSTTWSINSKKILQILKKNHKYVYIFFLQRIRLRKKTTYAAKIYHKRWWC